MPDDAGRTLDGVRLVLKNAAKDVSATRGGGNSEPDTIATFTVTIDPGKRLPDDYEYKAIQLRVLGGQLQAGSRGGRATVEVGSGGPISLSDGSCDSGTCELRGSQTATLNPGNGLSLIGGNLEASASGDASTELEMTVTLRDTDLSTRACWVCPGIRP